MQYSALREQINSRKSFIISLKALKLIFHLLLSIINQPN